MAEKPNKKEQGPSFADFLKEAPAAADLTGDDSVSLTGVVARSDKEGQFVLLTADGQSLELNTDAVKDYTVVQEQGPQKVVQLTVSAKALNPSAGATIGGLRTGVADVITRKELIKDPIFDTRKELIWDTIKELIKDPQSDPWTWVEQQGTLQEQIDPGGGFGVDPAVEAGGGLTPFIMATPHHASAAAVAMQPGAAAGGAAITLKEIPGDITRKELIKESIFDTRKEFIKDPITDPITWVENIGTAQEQVFDPGAGAVINPAIGGGGGFAAFQQQAQPGIEAGAGGLAQAATLAEQVGQFGTLIQDRITRKELIWDTYKELVKEPIWDTRKEVFETYVEGGGTIQEGPGGVDPGGIWNLPGMNF